MKPLPSVFIDMVQKMRIFKYQTVKGIFIHLGHRAAGMEQACGSMTSKCHVSVVLGLVSFKFPCPWQRNLFQG